MLGAYKAGNLNQNDILDKVVCRKCGKLFYFWFKTKLTNVELDFHLKKITLKFRIYVNVNDAVDAEESHKFQK